MNCLDSCECQHLFIKDRKGNSRFISVWNFLIDIGWTGSGSGDLSNLVVDAGSGLTINKQPDGSYVLGFSQQWGDRKSVV